MSAIGPTRSLAETAYAGMVSAADRHFGAICALTMVLASIGWFLGKMGGESISAVTLFLGVNLGLSRIALRMQSERSQFRMELARIFLVNGMLCPVVFILLPSPIAPWWPGYMIFTIGSALMLGSAHRPRWLVMGALAFWASSFVVAYYFARLLFPQAWEGVEWIQICMIASTLFLCGSVFHSMARTFAETLERERHMAESLRATERQLLVYERFAAIGELTSTLCHEIYNPITATNLSTRLAMDLLGQETLDRCKLGRCMEQIIMASKRIEDLAASLSRYANTGTAEEQVASILVSKILADAESIARARLQPSRIELAFEPCGAELRIACQPGRLLLFFLILINFAADELIDVSDEGGRGIRIRVGEEREHLRIEVDLGGIAFAAARARPVLQPYDFFGGSEHAGRMNLRLLLQVANSLGARVAFESMDGRPDSVFRAWLPLEGAFA